MCEILSYMDKINRRELYRWNFNYKSKYYFNININQLKTILKYKDSKYLMKYFCDYEFQNEDIINYGLTISPIIAN